MLLLLRHLLLIHAGRMVEPRRMASHLRMEPRRRCLRTLARQRRLQEIWWHAAWILLLMSLRYLHRMRLLWMSAHSTTWLVLLMLWRFCEVASLLRLRMMLLLQEQRLFIKETRWCALGYPSLRSRLILPWRLLRCVAQKCLINVSRRRRNPARLRCVWLWHVRRLIKPEREVVIAGLLRCGP